MKCKICNKDIEENQMYCQECKNMIDLQKTVEENKKLNELDKTREITDLSSLEKEEDKTAIVNLSSYEEIKESSGLDVSREELNKEKTKKKKNKALIIVLVCAFIVLIGSIIIFLVFNNKKDDSSETKVVNYRLILNEYGKSLNKTVSEYMKNSEESPTWQNISELNSYKEHEIICEIHSIYKDGNIYLNNCKIDGKVVSFSFGKEQIELADGKKLDIYKNLYESSINYTDKQESNPEKVGQIVCKTDDCTFEYGFEKYVIISENSEYYLYNYMTNILEYGPFGKKDSSFELNILTYNNILYGLFINNTIYNVNTGKTLKNLSGNSLNSAEASKMYKYGYIVLNSNNKNNFVNLNTGNVSYTISETIKAIVEDNNIAYILTTKNSNSTFKIYNSNGKELFEGKEYTDFNIQKDYFAVATSTNFIVYDKSLKLKKTSKTYDKIKKINKDFVVVIDDGYLEFVDMDDNMIFKFDLEWDNTKYEIYESGWDTISGEEAMYVVITTPDINIPVFLYRGYYIPSTKKSSLNMLK